MGENMEAPAFNLKIIRFYISKQNRTLRIKGKLVISFVIGKKGNYWNKCFPPTLQSTNVSSSGIEF